MEREKNPYFFLLQKIDDFEVKNNCMDFDQFLHRFFSVLTKGNRKIVRLIVSNPVSRNTLAGFVLFLHVEILKFWILQNRGHANRG